MKTELRLANHLTLKGHKVVEVWHDGRMVAQITGADEPGVRVFSRLPLATKESPQFLNDVNLLEVTIQ